MLKSARRNNQPTATARRLTTPEALAAWLLAGRGRDAKISMFGQLVELHGYPHTLRLWHEAAELWRRGLSTCRAGREGWAVSARPDGDGLVTCTGCGDRVTSLPHPDQPELRVVEAHRLAATPPVCGVDYDHVLTGVSDFGPGYRLMHCGECEADVVRAPDGTLTPAPAMAAPR